MTIEKNAFFVHRAVKYCQSIFDLHTPQSRPCQRFFVDQQGRVSQRCIIIQRVHYLVTDWQKNDQMSGVMSWILQLKKSNVLLNVAILVQQVIDMLSHRQWHKFMQTNSLWNAYPLGNQNQQVPWILLLLQLWTVFSYYESLVEGHSYTNLETLNLWQWQELKKLLNYPFLLKNTNLEYIIKWFFTFIKSQQKMTFLDLFWTPILIILPI